MASQNLVGVRLQRRKTEAARMAVGDPEISSTKLTRAGGFRWTMDGNN